MCSSDLQNHFVVCYAIKKAQKEYKISVSDPASQLITYTEQEFKKCWLMTKEGGEDKGAALLLACGIIRSLYRGIGS